MKRKEHLTADDWIESQYGRLDEAGRRRLDGHLSECASCREFAAGLSDVRQLFQIHTPVPSAEQWTGIRSLVMKDFRRHRSVSRVEIVQRLRDAAGRMWLFLTDDPLAAMAYTCAATGYLLYSLLSMSEFQSFVPGPDQVLSLIRFAF